MAAERRAGRRMACGWRLIPWEMELREYMWFPRRAERPGRWWWIGLKILCRAGHATENGFILVRIAPETIRYGKFPGLEVRRCRRRRREDLRRWNRRPARPWIP